MHLRNVIKISITISITCLFLSSCHIEEREKNVTTNTSENITQEKINKNESISEDVEDLTLYIATDLHYLSNNINDKGEAFTTLENNLDGRQLNYIDDILTAFTFDIKQNVPDILIVSGDLTHNGELASHKDLAKKFSVIESYGTDVLVVPGNHDINNPWARGFEKNKQIKVDSVTQEDFEEIYKDFGFSEAYLRDDNSLSYATKVSEDLWVLMLDTAIYNKNTSYPTTNGKLSKETLKWIDEVASIAKRENAKIITAMHHNLYKHNDLLYKGFVIDNNEVVLENFKKNNLNLVFSGHIHIQNIAKNEEIYDIVNSALTIYPIQYGVLNFNKVDGFKYYTNEVNVEHWAISQNIKDENLKNFNKYKEDYFYKKSYENVYESLFEKNTYTVDEIEQMSNTFALLNLNYFAGTVYNVKDDILNSNGYSLWLEEDDSFVKKYVLSMIKNSDEDKNTIFKK